MAIPILISYITPLRANFQCNFCGSYFIRYVRVRNENYNCFCSHACSNRGRIDKNVIISIQTRKKKIYANKIKRLENHAKIAEFYVNNPNFSYDQIKRHTGIDISVITTALRRYYKRGGDNLLIIESGIDTPKAILQEIELSFKENIGVLNITQ